ncbi:hypothetical protein [Zymobacter sp. IVIA_5232.4 C2]
MRKTPIIIAGLAAYAGLYNLKAGDGMTFKIRKGHLIANGTFLF